MSQPENREATILASIKDRQSTERLVMVITFLLVVIMAARSPLDSDLWWHIRAGEETLRSGTPMLFDTLSYTRTGAAWINHSWLAEVILAGIFRAGSYPALTTLVALGAAAALLFCYFQMEGPALLRAFAVILAATVSAVVWSARPQLFSLLLLAVSGWILYQYKYHDRDFLWLLIPLFILWSNLHGGYPLGLMAIGAMVAGELLNNLLQIHTAPILSWKKIVRLSIFGAVGFLAVVINPNGIQMWLIPFKTVNVGALQQFVAEWASPDFHDITQLPYLVLLFGCVVAWAMAGRRADGTDLITYLLFGSLGFLARRNFGPFALMASPILVRSLRAAFSTVQDVRWMRLSSGQNRSIPPALQKAVNLIIVAVLGLTAVIKLGVVSNPAFIDAQIRQSYPAGAVAYLKSHQPAGRLFNSYNWGGYLEVFLPEYPVFIDGRTDLFGDDLLGQWIEIVQAGDGWQNLLEKWNVRLVLIEPERPLAGALANAGWKLLSQEQGYVLYER